VLGAGYRIPSRDRWSLLKDDGHTGLLPDGLRRFNRCARSRCARKLNGAASRDAYASVRVFNGLKLSHALHKLIDGLRHARLAV